MARIAIIGGKLQGIEAAWLAGQAGWHRILIDRRRDRPASGLCEEVFCFDVRRPSLELIALLKSVDVILPVLEEDEALASLTALATEHNLPLAFDPSAYRITSDKLASDRLIHRLSIPAPAPNPTEGPCIVKPARSSGSLGVRLFAEVAEAQAYLRNLPPAVRTETVFQEYVAGRAYSIEVVGRPGDYRSYAVTEIHVDDRHDCRLVTTPCPLPRERVVAFQDTAVRLAEALSLRGIMDVEAIDSGGEMKVLELDARLPSQTPAAILLSTGINLLREWMAVFLGAGHDGGLSTKGETGNAGGFGGGLPTDGGQGRPFPNIRPAAYENILVDEGRVIPAGEHIMGEAGPLSAHAGFCGADVALTDWKAGCRRFRGIYINSGADAAELQAKREEMYKRLLCSGHAIFAHTGT